MLAGAQRHALPDGRLKLFDDHLRQSMDPGMEVDVEVLDVSNDEARALLLSIDPLAQFADYDQQSLAPRLLPTVATGLAHRYSRIGNCARCPSRRQPK